MNDRALAIIRIATHARKCATIHCDHAKRADGRICYIGLKRMAVAFCHEIDSDGTVRFMDDLRHELDMKYRRRTQA